MKRFCWICLCAGALAAAADDASRMPMTVNYAESAYHRWLQKKVLHSRLLDDMESTASWTLEGKAEMTLTTERSKDGKHSLRLST